MVDHLRRLAAHGAWADARLLRATASAPGDVAPVLRELSHIRGAQETWLSRVDGRSARLAVWPTLTIADLEADGSMLDAALRDRLADLQASALERIITYSNSAGTAFHTRLGDILLQVFLHGQYHRGKANAALRAAGAEAVNVDFITWQREMASL